MIRKETFVSLRKIMHQEQIRLRHWCMTQDFHLKQILPCLLRRPKQVIQRDNVIACPTLELNAHTFDPRIREAAAYWSYACTIQLGDQEKICAALFRFIFADVDHQQAARNSIVELLDIGNRKAQCVVLELAVWKFLCTIQCPGNVSGILELSEWSR
jgi:hypothetical protein